MDHLDIDDFAQVPESKDGSTGRRQYAFDKRTGACKQRVDDLAEFMAQCGWRRQFGPSFQPP